MNETIEIQKCAHPVCGCPVEGNEKYCSPQCEQGFDQTDCGCGHAGCRAQA